MASQRPVIVSEVAMHTCNLCDPEGVRLQTLCARVHHLYICFQCAGQLLTAIQTQSVFIEAPDVGTEPNSPA